MPSQRCYCLASSSVSELELHPEKTKIVYCKDVRRQGKHAYISFDFLGFTFRARRVMWPGSLRVHGFLPAVSRGALKTISRTIRRWRLHLHSDKPLDDLIAVANPRIRGWISFVVVAFCRFFTGSLCSGTCHNPPLADA
ncbi:MAG: group II intron maturase-specific domain-containing protein [Geminicoccales bacterium]